MARVRRGLRRSPKLDAIAMALSAPLRNPGRSALTAVGLAIGVGAFIAMISFGRGARSSVVAQFETLGSNLLRIKPGSTAKTTDIHPLDEADVNALRREATTLDLIVPFYQHSMEVEHLGQRHRTSVRGMPVAFSQIRDEGFSQGGQFDEMDVVSHNKVCIVGATVVDALFGREDPLGKVITLNDRMPCRVIGVFESKGINITGHDEDNRIVVPITTFVSQFGSRAGFSYIEVRPKPGTPLAAAQREVMDILRTSHDLAADEHLDFQILSPDEVTRVAEQIGGILTALLAGIAGVSLLVGGIGIMNIQLMSVAERTHEIGIRAAIGASPRQILRQFLAEAVVLATLGSAAGVALGVGASVLVAQKLGWPHATTLDVVLGSALFGIGVGTVFGYIPAKRAADLDPIDALRRE